jgi:hypothetical protein
LPVSGAPGLIQKINELVDKEMAGALMRTATQLPELDIVNLFRSAIQPAAAHVNPRGKPASRQ